MKNVTIINLITKESVVKNLEIIALQLLGHVMRMDGKKTKFIMEPRPDERSESGRQTLKNGNKLRIA